MKILQITDTHLLKKDSLLFKKNPNQSFLKVFSLIENDLQNIDAIFLTGDVSQDMSIESYDRIGNLLNKINKNVYWIPGNHDLLSTMKASFSKFKNFINTDKLELDNWQFIFLNSTTENEDFGFLSQHEINKLKENLASNTTKNTAIVMHHHPFKVNTPLIDKYILKNKDLFWEIILKASVKLVITGHVHGDYSIVHKNTQLETAPATCFQFEKGAESLEIVSKIGYKIYTFYENDFKAESKLWEI